MTGLTGVTRSFGPAVVVYALILAGACAITAASGGRRGPGVTAGLVTLQVAVLVQAALDVVALARGHHGDEVAVNLGYLLTSLAVLPVALSATRSDSGRWGNAALAVGCLLLAVITVRLHQTLGDPRA